MARTRTVEMVVLWDDRTWTDCNFVEVPENSVSFEEAGRDAFLSELDDESRAGVVGVYLYNMEVDEDFDDYGDEEDEDE